MVRQFKPDPNDIIIVIMGPTGSGKTNFINKLTGNTEQPSASRLRSDTQYVTPYPISYHNRRLLFVDTPGFDDTYRPDAEILSIIARWLTGRYTDGTRINVDGIIYLHRITDNRLSGSVYKNLQLFGCLCGNLSLSRARLVTTMWDGARNKEAAERKEDKLICESWRKLLDEGAKTRRFYNTKNCAWDIVDELIASVKNEDELLLQEELDGQKKRLYETEAAKVLYSRFQQLLAEQKKALKDLADEERQALDPVLAKSLQEEYDKIDAQLQATFKEMEKMKIPLLRRIRLWLPFRKSRAAPVMIEDRDSPRGRGGRTGEAERRVIGTPYDAWPV